MTKRKAAAFAAALLAATAVFGLSFFGARMGRPAAGQHRQKPQEMRSALAPLLFLDLRLSS